MDKDREWEGERRGKKRKGKKTRGKDEKGI
jgi:hypothetical protein